MYYTVKGENKQNKYTLLQIKSVAKSTSKDYNIVDIL